MLTLHGFGRLVCDQNFKNQANNSFVITIGTLLDKNMKIKQIVRPSRRRPLYSVGNPYFSGYKISQTHVLKTFKIF